MNKRWIWLALLAAGLVLFASLFMRKDTGGELDTPVYTSMPFETASQYARVTGPQPLQFPTDHGPHDDFLTEWWYYTGNLQTASGRHFGYQLTFFRRALEPADDRSPRQSSLAVDQIYMAHFAITDTEGNTFFPAERFERGTAGLAGAQSEPLYRVWLNDWEVTQSGQDVYQLTASQPGIRLDLQLLDEKGFVLQGDQGYSPKGPEPGNASIYISQTRLLTSGTLTLDEESFPVTGTSWMDHEYSTSALGEGLVGWDWFSIQLSDESELMLFTLRREDGSFDPYSSGTLITREGQTIRLAQSEFTIDVTDEWSSPHSGARYPSGWIISVPSQQLLLQVTPRIKDQELNLSFTYWEGAVLVEGTKYGQNVRGNGYVELTGYAESMQGQF